MAKATKVCKKCGNRKPVRSFYPSANCRPCFMADNKERLKRKQENGDSRKVV